MTRLLAWVGALCLAVAAAFGVRWAIDRRAARLRALDDARARDEADRVFRADTQRQMEEASEAIAARHAAQLADFDGPRDPLSDRLRRARR